MKRTTHMPQAVAGPGGWNTLRSNRSAQSAPAKTGSRRRIAIAASGVLALVLAGCGGATVGSSTNTTSAGAGTAAGAAAKCGNVNLAVNPWVGYSADAAVISYVAKTDLGCTVTEKNITEQVSWQGFGTGDVDVIMEDWGHPDLQKKYVDQQHVAEVVGQTGNVGQIGWFVPPWMAKKYPDITDWKNLNKYASLFKTSESGGKGQLLDGDPSWLSYDPALVKNLKLNFKVVSSGSEAAQITAFRQAEKDQKPLLGYFYSPQWFLSEVPLVKVNLPAYTTGCDKDTAKVACDYASTPLPKVAATKFMDSGSPAATLVKNFNWTNEDQNTVAKYISADKMTPEAAAQKWVEANQTKVKAWLPAS
jgi:glycine betaine/proline transport system substrate-binding protein